MLSSIKKSSFYGTLVHTKNYLITALANEGIKFISIPVLTYLLTTSDYGILNIFASWVSILSVLVVFNLNGSISRYFYEYSEDFKQFLGFSIVITSLVFGVSTFFILLFRESLAGLLELPDMLIYFLIPAILFEVINITFRQVYQPIKESKRIKKYSIGTVYLTFILTVAFILLREDTKYIGRLQALIVVSGVYSLIKLRDVFKYYAFGYKRSYLSYIAKFSLPNIPYLLSGVILSQFDRILINSELGSSQAGLYSFAYNIGALQIMLSNSIHNAWTPQYYAHMKDNNQGAIIKDASLYSKLIALGATFLILFGMELGRVLSSASYHESLNMIPWIVFGLFFVGISPFNKNAIQYVKKTHINAILTLSVGVINIILNIWLIPVYGAIAAAYTTLFCYFLLFSVEFMVVKYFLKIPIVPLKTFSLPFVIVLISLTLFYLFFSGTELNLITLVLKACAIGILTLLLFYKEINTNLIK